MGSREGIASVGDGVFATRLLSATHSLRADFVRMGDRASFELMRCVASLRAWSDACCVSIVLVTVVVRTAAESRNEASFLTKITY